VLTIYKQLRSLCLLQLLLPDYVRFNCCSPIMSTSRCSLVVPTSVAAPRLHQLLLLLPNCISFCCCSRITSASAAAPRLRPLVITHMQYKVHVRRSRVISLVPPPEHPTSITHAHSVTHTHTQSHIHPHTYTHTHTPTHIHTHTQLKSHCIPL